MALETERKYLHPDLNRLRGRLPRINAVFVRRDWEDNLVLDTPGRTLRRDHILLRLRHTGVSTLTLKKKASVHFNESQYVKALEELETIVADGTAMRAILESLGFVAAFKYEKFRETWQWRQCTICLDILPFMEAVELEGDPVDIEQTATHLELDGLEASTLTYHQLHQAHRRALGLSPAEDFVFSEEHKARIKESLPPIHFHL